MDLFIETPTFEKTASIKLSEDINEWPIQITQHLHEEHPYLVDESSEVIIKRSDALRGYGYGFVKIGENVRVPVIVNQYEMSPLDVWLDKKGLAHVLDEDAVRGATQSTTLGKAIKQQTDGYVDSLIYSRTYPPYDGKYVYAAANHETEIAVHPRPYVSVLSSIPMTPEERKVNFEKLAQSVVAGFHANGTDVTVLKPWLSDGFEKVAAERDKRASPIGAYCSEDAPIPDAIIKEDMNTGDPQVADSYGDYLCEGKSGERYIGHVFPHVYDFDLKPVDLAIFKGRWQPDVKPGARYPVGPKICSSVQARIAGIKLPKSRKLHDDHARSNERGFFVKEKGEAAVALIPVTILSVARSREHHETKRENETYDRRIKIETDYEITKFYCKTDLGEAVTIVKSPNTTDVKRSGSTVFIPGSMIFCRLETPITLKEDPEMIKKAALADYGVNDMRVNHIDGVFSFHGTNVDGYELQAGVPEKEARDFLEQTWTKEASEKIIKRAQQGKPGIATTIHVAIAPPKFEKTASDHIVEVNEEGVVLTDPEAFALRLQYLTRDFDKIAATLQDSGLVDSVLSLKFINKENIDKYAEFAPQFEEAVNHLADLLIASRVGLQIQEEAVKTAMKNMAIVVRELKTLKGIK
jgi:hypothetical protein